MHFHIWYTRSELVSLLGQCDILGFELVSLLGLCNICWHGRPFTSVYKIWRSE